jgi:hypothetical protein
VPLEVRLPGHVKVTVSVPVNAATVHVPFAIFALVATRW